MQISALQTIITAQEQRRAAAQPSAPTAQVPPKPQTAAPTKTTASPDEFTPLAFKTASAAGTASPPTTAPAASAATRRPPGSLLDIRV